MHPSKHTQHLVPPPPPAPNLQVYLEDLAELPENPWALKGLAQTYAAMGPAAADKAAAVSVLGLAREEGGGGAGAQGFLGGACECVVQLHEANLHWHQCASVYAAIGGSSSRQPQHGEHL
jgi:hypothetical protein